MNPIAANLGSPVSRITDNLCLVKARHGLFVASRIDFYVGGSLVRYGEYSEEETRLLVALLEPGQTVVEIGANIGAHTVPMARRVGPAGHLLAFEVQPVIFQYLCANIVLNGLLNVVTHDFGCGTREETLHLPPIDYERDRKANFGAVSLQREAQHGGLPVRVRPLDDVLRHRKVDLIKLDVEGMEGEVIAGAVETIARDRPLMYVENDRAADVREALIREIRALGYRMWWHRPRLFSPENFFRVAENDYGNTVSINMLCVPLERSCPASGLSEVA